jgi:lysophospholipase L1-like esterase
MFGDKGEIIEEGLNSRTLISDDQRVGKEGKNGSAYLLPCLDTHDPIDLVILMLGTNELKAVYDKNPEQIGQILDEYFVKKILTRKSQFKDHYPKLLIVAPPIVNEHTSYCMEGNKYSGANEKSKRLNDIYQQIAANNDCLFCGNKGLETGIDGVHLTEQSHKLLAESLKKQVVQHFRSLS